MADTQQQYTGYPPTMYPPTVRNIFRSFILMNVRLDLSNGLRSSRIVSNGI